MPQRDDHIDWPNEYISLIAFVRALYNILRHCTVQKFRDINNFARY